MCGAHHGGVVLLLYNCIRGFNLLTPAGAWCIVNKTVHHFGKCRIGDRMPVKSTITDVAREARVSKSAVSAVLARSRRNSSVRVSDGTRQRIIETASRLGYRPSNLASGLAGGRTYTAGLLWPLGNPPSNALVAQDLVIRLLKRGYLTYLTSHLVVSGTSTITILDEFHRQKVDIAILMIDGPKHYSQKLVERLVTFRSALVISNTHVEVPCDLIVYDRFVAIRQVVAHFAGTGRKRLGYMMPLATDLLTKFDHFQAQAGESGCESTFIDVTGPQLRRQPQDYWCTLDRRLKDGQKFDALLCSTDEGAMAVIDCLRTHGLKVPEDVAVVGFNDSNGAAYVYPPLASVGRREHELVDKMETMIFDRLDSEEVSPRIATVAMEFVWRKSAGGNGPDRPRSPQ